MQRDRVPDGELQAAVADLLDALQRKLKKHGDLEFAGQHEILGQFTEEYKETIEAVHANDKVGLYWECADMAVVALWGMASLLHQGVRPARNESGEA